MGESQISSKTYPDYREEREQSMQVKKMNFRVSLFVLTSYACGTLENFLAFSKASFTIYKMNVVVPEP